MRLSYPTNIKIVKLPCTGKIDVLYLLKAFQSGADGVYVAGCMEGDCHYLTGNLRARKRVEYAKKILDEVGIGGERLAMYNMSAAQATRFVEVANEMNERIKELGPNPIKQKSEVGSQKSEEKEQKTEVV
jgi:coenzyme F420-reducing hydrogenase delta subunit